MIDIDKIKNWWGTLCMFLVASIGITGFFLSKNSLIIEFGMIVFTIGFIQELRGMKKKLWLYSSSPIYMIAGRIPIEIALSYLFLGMTAATYIIFRLSW
jgi:hypothetical protein